MLLGPEGDHPDAQAAGGGRALRQSLAPPADGGKVLALLAAASRARWGCPCMLLWYLALP